jgi:GNAT superfamily N-acetyltransferase
MPHHEPSANDVVVRVLREPPEAGFDCGRDEQTRFLRERAWADQQARLSVTYCYYLDEVLAAYAAVCMDAISLGKKEREPDVRYSQVGAVKLAQLGVSVPFQHRGIGRRLLADVIALARKVAKEIGCRYVTLDAQPDLVGWYESQGFDRNQFRQTERILDALMHGREPERIAVSMRYDLREVEA